MTSNTPEPAESGLLSWDSASLGAPERPSFASNLPDSTLIGRPRRVTALLLLVAVAVMTFTTLNLSAAFRFDNIRAAAITVLPEDLTTDYSESDIRQAVLLLLAVVGGLCLILSLIQISSAHFLRARRSQSSRVFLVIGTVLQLPIAFLALALRDGGIADTALSAGAGAILLTAMTLACTPAVSQWLKQNERPRTVLLVSAEPKPL